MGVSRRSLVITSRSTLMLVEAIHTKGIEKTTAPTTSRGYTATARAGPAI